MTTYLFMPTYVPLADMESICPHRRHRQELLLVFGIVCSEHRDVQALGDFAE